MEQLRNERMYSLNVLVASNVKDLQGSATLFHKIMKYPFVPQSCILIIICMMGTDWFNLASKDPDTPIQVLTKYVLHTCMHAAYFESRFGD